MNNNRLTACLTCVACCFSSVAFVVLVGPSRSSAAEGKCGQAAAVVATPQPATARDYYRRGRAESAAGRCAEALSDFDQAIALDPKFGAAFNSRGNEYFRLGDYERAIADYNEAVFLDPNPGVVYCNRAGAWLACGEIEIALDDYREAIERNPRYAPAYFGRANAWASDAKYSQAVADYRAAIQIDPQFAEAYDNLAWLLASGPASQHRNGKQAVEMSTKACELTGWERADFIATLAAAYAEAGNFADAIHWQKRAIELAPDRKAYSDRLVTYYARRPYHSQPSKEL